MRAVPISISVLLTAGASLAAWSSDQRQHAEVAERAVKAGFEDVLLVADLDGAGPPNAVVQTDEGVLVLRDGYFAADESVGQDTLLIPGAAPTTTWAERVDTTDIDDLVLIEPSGSPSRVRLRVYFDPARPDARSPLGADIDLYIDKREFVGLDLATLVPAAPRSDAGDAERRSGITEVRPAPEPEALAPPADGPDTPPPPFTPPQALAQPTVPPGAQSYPPPPTGTTPSPADADGDGVTVADGDCDDANPNIRPGVWEYGYDGVDADCGGSDATDIGGSFATAWTGPELFVHERAVDIDSDGDGHDDLLAWTRTSQDLYLLPSSQLATATGAIEDWGTPILVDGAGGFAVASAAGAIRPSQLPDLTGDGLPELAIGHADGSIWLLDGATWPAGAGNTPSGPPWATLQLAPAATQFGLWAAQVRPLHDVDGDGAPDLLVESLAEGTVYLLLTADILVGGVTDVAATAALRIHLSRTPNTSSPLQPSFLPLNGTTGDMTGDGVPEVVYTEGPHPSTTHIIDGADLATLSGDHDLAAVATWTAPHRLREQGDFDGDGRMDLLLTSKDMLCMTNPSGQGLQCGPTQVEPLILHLAAGLPPGGGASTRWITTGKNWVGVHAADLDSSGAEDLVVTAYNPTTARFEAEVFLDPGAAATGGPIVAPHVTLADQAPLLAVVLASEDLNGDGKADLLVDRANSAGPRPDTPSVLLSPL